VQKDTAKEWLVVNSSSENSICITGRSRKMLFYELPTDARKHSEG
jgi:hypothetical protein